MSDHGSIIRETQSAGAHGAWGSCPRLVKPPHKPGQPGRRTPACLGWCRSSDCTSGSQAEAPLCRKCPTRRGWTGFGGVGVSWRDCGQGPSGGIKKIPESGQHGRGCRTHKGGPGARENGGGQPTRHSRTGNPPGHSTPCTPGRHGRCLVKAATRPPGAAARGLLVARPAGMSPRLISPEVTPF